MSSLHEGHVDTLVVSTCTRTPLATAQTSMRDASGLNKPLTVILLRAFSPACFLGVALGDTFGFGCFFADNAARVALTWMRLFLDRGVIGATILGDEERQSELAELAPN